MGAEIGPLAAPALRWLLSRWTLRSEKQRASAANGSDARRELGHLCYDVSNLSTKADQAHYDINSGAPGLRPPRATFRTSARPRPPLPATSIRPPRAMSIRPLTRSGPGLAAERGRGERRSRTMRARAEKRGPARGARGLTCAPRIAHLHNGAGARAVAADVMFAPSWCTGGDGTGARGATCAHSKHDDGLPLRSSEYSPTFTKPTRPSASRTL